MRGFFLILLVLSSLPGCVIHLKPAMERTGPALAPLPAGAPVRVVRAGEGRPRRLVEIARIETHADDFDLAGGDPLERAARTAEEVARGLGGDVVVLEGEEVVPYVREMSGGAHIHGTCHHYRWTVGHEEQDVAP